MIFHFVLFCFLREGFRPEGIPCETLRLNLLSKGYDAWKHHAFVRLRLGKSLAVCAKPISDPFAANARRDARH